MIRSKLIFLLFFFISSQSLAIDTVYSVKKLAEIKVCTLEKKVHYIRSKKPLVFVFLSPECPLCKNYTITLNTLFKNYQSDIDLIGIIPGRSYSAETIKKFKKDFSVRFPIYIDKKKSLTNFIGATVTPQVFFLQDNGIALYSGAIDDWIVSLGKKKSKIDIKYLENAIISYKKGIPIKITYVPPVGCLINDL